MVLKSYHFGHKMQNLARLKILNVVKGYVSTPKVTSTTPPLPLKRNEPPMQVVIALS